LKVCHFLRLKEFTIATMHDRSASILRALARPMLNAHGIASAGSAPTALASTFRSGVTLRHGEVLRGGVTSSSPPVACCTLSHVHRPFYSKEAPAPATNSDTSSRCYRRGRERCRNGPPTPPAGHG